MRDTKQWPQQQLQQLQQQQLQHLQQQQLQHLQQQQQLQFLHHTGSCRTCTGQYRVMPYLYRAVPGHAVPVPGLQFLYR
ncbi:hypothetical protein FHG87_025033 [Trinorchestia longiramus]|nr:hypothetical protein FHG87_025033 [Trinorchestia longiramus]